MTKESETDMTDRNREGLLTMNRIMGEDTAAEIRSSFAAISPDFGAYVLEAGFADVYGRPGLTLAQRQLLNVGVLTAIGGVERQLRAHIRGALNVGVTPDEVVEAIFHVALYAGHPRAVGALWAAREVFDSVGVDVDLASNKSDA